LGRAEGTEERPFLKGGGIRYFQKGFVKIQMDFEAAQGFLRGQPFHLHRQSDGLKVGQVIAGFIDINSDLSGNGVHN